MDKIIFNDKGTDATVEFTLDFWVSRPQLINDKTVQGEKDADISVKVMQKVISDEYGSWYFSPSIHDREYLIVQK
ncbi:hypothetical protein D3C73_1522870 [compost metagenome]